MIDPEDISRLKEIFVTKDECEGDMKKVTDRLASGNTRFALIEQKLDTISWVSKTTLGVIIAAIVGAIVSLILK